METPRRCKVEGGDLGSTAHKLKRCKGEPGASGQTEKPSYWVPDESSIRVVACWTESTLIEYGQNGKKLGTKSHERYERYSKARTVGEALALGSKAQDLLFDHEKGMLRAVGGKVRETPLGETGYASLGGVLTRTDKIML